MYLPWCRWRRIQTRVSVFVDVVESAAPSHQLLGSLPSVCTWRRTRDEDVPLIDIIIIIIIIIIISSSSSNNNNNSYSRVVLINPICENSFSGEWKIALLYILELQSSWFHKYQQWMTSWSPTWILLFRVIGLSLAWVLSAGSIDTNGIEKRTVPL